MNTIPILIIGAGPVGLSLALALARFNVPHRVIERRSGRNIHPRARGVNARTMELFRQWGNLPFLLPHEMPKEARRFIWAESLQGEEISRNSMEDNAVSLYSPVQAGLVSQDFVEDSLYEALQLYDNSQVDFSHEFLSYTTYADHVLVQIYNHQTQQKELIKTKFLIAADGANSKVRRQTEISMNGPDNLGFYCSIYSEFDISKWTRHRPCIGYFFTDQKLRGKFLAAIDNQNRWIVGIRLLEGQKREDFTQEYCIQVIRELTQCDDLQVNILDINFWKMGAQVASELSKDRVYLVGDAAHRLPPTGGFGMNTGIQDAHNLAWKLAYVINHSMPESLLATYSVERMPIAQQNINWSQKNSERFSILFRALQMGNMDEFKSGLEEQQKTHLNSLGLDLGFIYHSPIIFSENDQTLSISSSQYVPSTLPGARAPHYWLKRNNETISTLDLFDFSFTFLIGPQGQAWEAALNLLLPSIHFPIHYFRISDDTAISDPNNNWYKIYEISTKGIVLIRPDGHVAWRAASGVQEDMEITLRRVISTAAGIGV